MDRLCSAESRCDLTQQFLRANIHSATRREHLALFSGNRLASGEQIRFLLTMTERLCPRSGPGQKGFTGVGGNTKY